MRVVSLVPSITETLIAWGIRPVAVTKYCEQPAFATVGGTKNPDLDAIVALAPDLVVVDTEENRLEDYDELRRRGLHVHATTVRAVSDVDRELDELAGALGIKRPAATDVGRHVDAGVAELSELRVFVPIWRRPWMAINGDTYGSSVLASLGLHNVTASADDRYPTVTLDEVAALRPDVTLVPTEPYSFGAAHHAELERELGCPAVTVDGQDLFWWGVRTSEAPGRIAAALEVALAAAGVGGFGR